MSEKQISFKQRVCKKQPFYIVSAEKNNYQHLAGVSYSYSADDFFDKCLNGTLTKTDISFSISGRSEAEIKGSVRRKTNDFTKRQSVR